MMNSQKVAGRKLDTKRFVRVLAKIQRDPRSFLLSSPYRSNVSERSQANGFA